MRTERSARPGCRLVKADFCAAFLLALGGVCGAQAADVPTPVAPPQPVVLQTTATMAPPPPIPDATESAPRPASKQLKKAAAKSVKPAKAKAIKPAGKPKGKTRKL